MYKSITYKSYKSEMIHSFSCLSVAFDSCEFCDKMSESVKVKNGFKFPIIYIVPCNIIY